MAVTDGNVESGYISGNGVWETDDVISSNSLNNIEKGINIINTMIKQNIINSPLGVQRKKDGSIVTMIDSTGDIIDIMDGNTFVMTKNFYWNTSKEMQALSYFPDFDYADFWLYHALGDLAGIFTMKIIVNKEVWIEKVLDKKSNKKNIAINFTEEQRKYLQNNPTTEITINVTRKSGSYGTSIEKLQLWHNYYPFYDINIFNGTDNM